MSERHLRNTLLQRGVHERDVRNDHVRCDRRVSVPNGWRVVWQPDVQRRTTDAVRVRRRRHMRGRNAGSMPGRIHLCERDGVQDRVRIEHRLPAVQYVLFQSWRVWDVCFHPLARCCVQRLIAVHEWPVPRSRRFVPLLHRRVRYRRMWRDVV